MKLLIDANIVLDVLQAREPHLRDSALIWKLCETGQAEGWVTVLSFANLVYVMRRELSPEQVKELLAKLRLIFRFAEYTAADMQMAAELCWPDFEDAVQSVTAERLGADCIITRNVRDFNRSPIPALTPAEYLARL